MSPAPREGATPVGWRPARALEYLEVPRFTLECGAVLHDLVQAYHLEGTLAPDGGNLVLIFHALTGAADTAGGWWPSVVGPGQAIDTDRWAVLSPNLLGSCYGSSGPTETGGDFPPITTRDQARFAACLVEALGVPLDRGALALVAGGSLGGMVTLEWAASFPRSARSAVSFAAPAAHPAWATGWNHVQRAALDLAGPARVAEGLALARMIAMLSYRSGEEFEERFGRERDDTGRFSVERYLAHQGARLVARFDSASYRALLGAMDAHDVGRGRGGVGAALRAFEGALVGVGIPGDVLYDAAVVRAWTAAAGARYHEVHSAFGHDAFLLESEQVSALLGAVLGEVAATRTAPRSPDGERRPSPGPTAPRSA